jgi:hypothetical protein
MLLKNYHLEYCRPPNPGATHLRGLARLDAEITEVKSQEQSAGQELWFNRPSLRW